MLFKYKYVVWNVYYLGHLASVVVLALPLRHIVRLYLYVLTALLLYVGHQISRDYVRGEVHSGYEGAIYLDSMAFNRFVSALTSQIILSTLCAFLMKSRQVWLFSAHLLPLFARLCAVSHGTLLMVSSFATVLTGVEVAVFLLSNLFVPYQLARAAYREVQQLEALELYRLLALGISLWNQLAVPTLFSVFWVVLFLVQLYSYATASNNFVSHQGVLFLFLTSVSECCATPYSLLGLTFVVSYLALGLLNLCKFYLGGFAAVQNENVMHRGVTEGVTLLLLALQTGLLDMQVLQRTFLLSIILFIVVTSTLQSMIEITDPVILALGASRSRCLWKHCRGLSMCLFLLAFPGFMAYKICQFFHMDFWLLILVSSCMLTSLQVTGTLLIYSLFMVELVRQDPIESLDEVIYCVNAVSRVLEFLVALCVVAYGTWESLFGEWSWMGASVIIIHSYFNVWLRAQSGWRSFLLRREAAKKINSLPRASDEQLRRHSDVCAICFQEMSSAVVTHCGHFFHGNCLRKWLYVQESCPMCHQPVKPSVSPQGGGPEPAGTGRRPVGEQSSRAPSVESVEEGAHEQSPPDSEGQPTQEEDREEDASAAQDGGLLGCLSSGCCVGTGGDWLGSASPHSEADHTVDLKSEGWERRSTLSPQPASDFLHDAHPEKGYGCTVGKMAPQRTSLCSNNGSVRQGGVVDHTDRSDCDQESQALTCRHDLVEDPFTFSKEEGAALGQAELRPHRQLEQNSLDHEHIGEHYQTDWCGQQQPYYAVHEEDLEALVLSAGSAGGEVAVSEGRPAS
ncbi:RING finger protein 145-like [Scleropages formosus]|nr:RING finger protein 145-like [Scleropages formosus]